MSSANSNSTSNFSTPRIHISVPRRSAPSAELYSGNPGGNPGGNHDGNSNSNGSSDEEAEFDMPHLAPLPLSHSTPLDATNCVEESTAVTTTATAVSTTAATTTTTAATPSSPPTTKASATTSNLWNGLRNQSLDFPINTECTSLRLSPSGNFLWAGFSDGTLRVFDLSGRFSLQTEDSWETTRQKSSTMLPSKFHQRFGAVACQIHARGVHTDLLMQVDLCGDYVFGGVPRGANELYAVSTRDLEAQATSNARPNPKNILDSLHVHMYADAKLKGFGACTQLQNTAFGRPTYLLLTGKGIKNIHIWKFQPPLNDRPDSQEEAIWEQLYDTPTNGNTIHLLSFYRTPLGKLWGVSQSDTQKLRLWDLSREDEGDDEGKCSKPRPKRPHHQDVANSQGALGIAGGYGVCGGPTMYNQLSIVSLDQPKSAYNHTELALPGAQMEWTSLSSTGGGRGRQRRGDLKQLVNVAVLPNDSNHALLELDDGSIVHYRAAGPNAGLPNLEIVSEESTGIAPLPADFWSRTLCLGKAAGLVVAAVGMYNPNTQLGHIEVRALQNVPSSPNFPSSPLDTDNCALSRLCMEAPPLSSLKKKKLKKKRVLEQVQQLKHSGARGVGVGVPEGTINQNSAMLATPRPVEGEASHAPASTRPVPISVEKSSTKHKKKSWMSNDWSSYSAANDIPPSIERDNRETQSVQVERRKKKTTFVDSNATMVKPVSSVASLKSVSPITETKITSEAKNMIPVSIVAAEVKLSAAAASASALPPQVSPSGSTPTAAPPQGEGETPSSTESNKKADHGTIAKFLKPVRVLHNYSEGDQKQTPVVEKVTSPPVPRKVRKTSHESEHTKKSAPTPNEENTGSTKLNDADGTLVEFKVRKTLKIQVGPKSSNSSDKKRAMTASKGSTNSDRDSHKRPRTEALPDHTLENVATMLVDLKTPPVSRTKQDVCRTKSKSDFTREEFILTQAKEEHKKLCQYIDSLPRPRSRLLSQTMDAMGSFARPSILTRVSNEHRACHDMIQKRLLHSAKDTLRSLVDNHVTLEVARSDLKDAIRSYQEVLHDTLKRQELELEAMVDENGEVPRLPLISHRSAFDKVQEIYNSLEPPKRPPGRPKASI